MRSLNLLVLIAFGALAAMRTTPIADASEPQPGPWNGIRERVLAAARPAYLQWIHTLAQNRASDFGFHSLEEARRAELLPPIPFYVPDRRNGDLTRSRIETLIESPSNTWLVPVAVEGRVVALVTLQTQAQQEPKAVEFGKTWAANRLDAGLRRSEKEGRGGVELRSVAFFSPIMDLLLIRRQGDSGWSWLELSGTETGRADVLNDAQIEARLKKIRDTGLRDEP